jgi:hypothetical protein
MFYGISGFNYFYRENIPAYRGEKDYDIILSFVFAYALRERNDFRMNSKPSFDLSSGPKQALFKSQDKRNLFLIADYPET